MKIKIDSIGFAQSDKYTKSLNCLKSGMILSVGGLILAAIGAYGMTHSSTWMISSTSEQTEEIVKIFKNYNDLCS